MLAPAVAALAVAGGATPAAAAVLMIIVLVGGVIGIRLGARSLNQRSEATPLTVTDTVGLNSELSTGRPLEPTERQLSARYGVWVEQVAGHVWLVDGELVEAVLDQSTGRLMTGSRELTLRTNRHP